MKSHIKFSNLKSDPHLLTGTVFVKKNQKYTQFKARNVVEWSPLDSTGDGSIIITERNQYTSFLNPSNYIELFLKSLMDRLSARLPYSPRIYSSTMDPVDFEERYF